MQKRTLKKTITKNYIALRLGYQKQKRIPTVIHTAYCRIENNRNVQAKYSIAGI